MQILEGVKDPEVPVLSVVELGVVRNVAFEKEQVVIQITPTYSGCPALKVMQDEIVSALKENGFPDVRVDIVYAPAWTTDWIGDAAREKLRRYGIAPPQANAADEIVNISSGSRPVPCPMCNSLDTQVQSQFGSTACKALHLCRSCKQPFEHFKVF